MGGGSRTGAGALGEPVLKSLDGVTSPVSVTRGPGGTLVVTMVMSPEGYGLVEELAEEARVGLEDVIARSLVLYRAAREAERAGRTVGAAADPEALDVRFLDL